MDLKFSVSHGKCSYVHEKDVGGGKHDSKLGLLKTHVRRWERRYVCLSCCWMPKSQKLEELRGCGENVLKMLRVKLKVTVKIRSDEAGL